MIIFLMLVSYQDGILLVTDHDYTFTWVTHHSIILMLVDHRCCFFMLVINSRGSHILVTHHSKSSCW